MSISSNHDTQDEISTIDLTEQGQPTDVPGIIVQRRQVGQVRASDLLPQRGGLLSTAREANGEPAFKLHSGTVIKVGSVAMSLERAEQLNFVRRNPQTGEYEEFQGQNPHAADAQRQVEQEAQQNAEAQFPVPMSEEGKGFLADLHGALQAIGASPREAVLEFLQDPIGAAEKYGPRLSRLTGSSEDDIAEDLLETRDELFAQLTALAQAEGIDPEEFGAFLGRNRHSAYAALLEAVDGDAMPTRRLIARFKQERPNYKRPTPEGLKTRKTQDGTEYIRVKLPGGRVIEVSVANARLQGWIK